MGSGMCIRDGMWREHRSTRLPCGHQPGNTDHFSCDVCRFWIDDLDERRGRPRRLQCGQPAAAPIRGGSCVHCRHADRTHGPADLLFCGHTAGCWVRHCPSCHARRLLLDTGGREHVDARRTPVNVAADREWSPPNRYDVMSGNFGPPDVSLEAQQRDRSARRGLVECRTQRPARSARLNAASEHRGD